MPPGTSAELIGGIVFMPSPLGRIHGWHHKAALNCNAHYERFASSVESLDNAAAILAHDSEPQPDVSLRIVWGGPSRGTSDGKIGGCPELVLEVANSAQSDDLHAKRRAFERYGAKEYVDVVVRTSRVTWFVRMVDPLVEVPPDADGVESSRTFPGLWLDPAALDASDMKHLAPVVEQGVATAQYVGFVAQPAARQP